MESFGDNDKRDVRRPMNAFLIFCKRHRSIVREKNPDLDNRSVTRILGDLWANLKDDEKVVYTDLAKQYKDAFMKANPDYKWHNPEKTVTCQKTGLPLNKPTNVKVLKNEMNLLPEGSIIPGKLADPCNMGGLSLLLMAGEQQSRLEQNDVSTVSTTNLKPIVTAPTNDLHISSDTNKITSLVLDKSTDDQNADGVKTKDMNQVVSDGAGRKKSVTDDNMLSLATNELSSKTNTNKSEVVEKSQGLKDFENAIGQQNIPFTNVKDAAPQTKSLLYQAMAAPKIPAISLLANAFKDNVDTSNAHTDILKDNSASAKMANVENQGHMVQSLPKNDTDTKLVCKNDEKENITQKVVPEVKLEDDSIKEEESPMVTCGKLVVNHIIDRLYSSDLSNPSKLTIVANGDEVDGGKEVKEEEKNGGVKMEVASIGTNVKNQVQLKQVSEVQNIKQFQAKDDQHELKMTEIKSDTLSESNDGFRERLDSVSSDGGPCNSGRGEKWKSSVAARGEDSTESEDIDDYHPAVRKSRRRNRGQRYQELINEGIIQLSKERMAALQNPAKKDESPEEDVKPIGAYSSYVLPETAIRRIRKRTTSESAKDKIMHPDDVKRYKTGDFDLEAQIATLPVCSVENLGRKRGFARQRHSSECIHTTQRKMEIEQLSSHTAQQVFDVAKIVPLPPNVKVAPEVVQEPVVGSRKRKARKHSITHMVPAPDTLIKNGKVKPEANVLGPCLIKPSETPLSDNNQIKEHVGEKVAMVTDSYVHSKCAEKVNIASECEEIVNKNNTKSKACDKTGEVPITDCTETGCDQCFISDSKTIPNSETQSENQTGAQMVTMETGNVSERLHSQENLVNNDLRLESANSDKKDLINFKSDSISEGADSDQSDAKHAGWKNEKDVNSNNTVNCK